MSDAKEEKVSEPSPGRAASGSQRAFNSSGNEYIATPFHERLFLALHLSLPFLLILLILAAGISAAVFVLKKQNGGDAPDAGRRALDSLPLSEDAFIEAYLQARGGLANMRGMVSLRMAGDIRMSGKTNPFTLIKKVPDQALLNIFFDTHELTVGVAGDVVWRRFEAADGTVEVSRVSDGDVSVYAGVRDFFDPLARCAAFGEGKIISVQMDTFEGLDCLRAELVEDPDGEPFIFYVDPDSMCTIAMFERLPDGRQFRVRFYDYRSVRGIPIPLVTESWIDGELRSAVYIDRVRANVGVMSSVFDLPRQLGE